VRIPKYRRRAGRDTAFCEFGGKRHALPGRYGSKESRDAYAAIIHELARDVPLPSANGLTVNELALAYLDFAKVYYDAKEYSAFRAVAGPLIRVAGSTPLSLFGPIALDRVRAELVRIGWCRQYINRQVNRIRRVFKWGVSKELHPSSVLEGLRSLDPLRAGRTPARDAPAVQPVDPKWVEATAEHASPVMAAMIRLQRLTGMRSQSLVALRPADIDRSDDVWAYTPRTHKTAYKGTELAVFLGPKCQDILRPFLDRDPEAACFSPRESSHHGARRNARYRVDTYCQAVGYACRAGAVTSRFFGDAEELLGKYGWYWQNSEDSTRPVGSKKPNDLGLFDMYGNVWNWCQGKLAPYPNEEKVFDDIEDDPNINPNVPRVFRGGAFISRALWVRSAYRSGTFPRERGSGVGFRPARTITAEPQHRIL